MKTVTIGTTPFEVREGAWMPTLNDFNPDGVQQMSNGKVRLKITKVNNIWMASGIIGPVIPLGGRIEFETIGRFDQFDPSTVFGAWGYHIPTKNEVDFLEATRWSDNNNDKLYHLGFFDKGTRITDPLRYHGRGIVKHKVSIRSVQSSTVGHYTLYWDIFGWQDSSQSWKNCGSNNAPHFPDMTLRFAMYFNGKVPFYITATDRGPLSIDIHKLVIT